MLLSRLGRRWAVKILVGSVLVCLASSSGVAGTKPPPPEIWFACKQLPAYPNSFVTKNAGSWKPFNFPISWGSNDSKEAIRNWFSKTLAGWEYVEERPGYVPSWFGWRKPGIGVKIFWAQRPIGIECFARGF